MEGAPLIPVVISLYLNYVEALISKCRRMEITIVAFHSLLLLSWAIGNVQGSAGHSSSVNEVASRVTANIGNVGVKRIVKIEPFYIVRKGPLELKCPEGSEFVSPESFSVCTPEFMDHKISAPRCKIDKMLVNTYNGYCANLFRRGEVCILSINQEAAGPERYAADFGIKCPNRNSIYNGLYYCKERIPRPVEDGEEVTVISHKSVGFGATCPPGKVIKTVFAFEFGPMFHEKGFKRSALAKAKAECDGKQECSLLTSENTGLNYVTYQTLTYKCV
ncbi:conserved hypothetical protein [Theileria equi strain WA]|uniref:SUEL-type lectin domain-containing protein n=1 Tax=Theileria equi strain WA TaxID=1537102 RepID=L1LFC6_THEEQ|nr:conserved hypothetical protein [Theileria equi strain WA]EKX73979.1 conserved hypothetical protein [Theileria equi strain WA]|eukprot:XP_004833431.1 conserved hypothetical protein [Theileria equi strain WA]